MSLKKHGASIGKALLAHFVNNAWLYVQLIGALLKEDYPTALSWLKALCIRTAIKLIPKLIKSRKRAVRENNCD
ncbi:hypothetical protein ACN9MZ_26135 [Pseudoduganella sp. S-14]|jgi:hypothetical protein|uniref:hypothetical protein n=1 Tax=Pseudoduganella sp. S-14 TaxID=3404065 RepID=UPI003CEBE8D1